MVNLKKILVVLLITILMIGVSNVVLATEADEDITFIPDEETNSTTNNTTNTNSLFNNTNATNNTTTNSSQYNNTSLPKAGSADSVTIIAIVAVFGVSALYAYKKIRDYNIK